MAYDPLDPMAALDPFAPRRRQEALTPEEEESILGVLGRKALGGLGYVGDALGKAFGGRALRGALGGRPRELLSVLPFSDALGITDPEQEVRGEQLLRDWGLLEGEGTKGEFELRDLAGPALEAVLDPGTYLTFGSAALSKGGRVAQKVGALPKTASGRVGATLENVLAARPDLADAAGLAAKASGFDLADVLRQPLGGHVGVGLPFAAPSAVYDLSGAGARAGQFLSGLPGAGPVGDVASKLGEAAGAAGRHLRSLFDKSVMGQTRPELQRIAEQASGQAPAARAGVMAGLQPILEQAAAAGVLREPARWDELVRHLENVPGSYAPEITGLGDLIRPALEENRQALRAVGLPAPDLADTLGYFPRQQTLTGHDPQWLTRRQLTPAGELAREDILRGVPTRGRGSLNEMTTRPDLRQMTDLQAAAAIRRDYLGVDEAELAALRQARAQDPSPLTAADSARLADLEARAVQSQRLADWVKTLPEEHVTNQIGYFSNNPFADLQEKLLHDQNRVIKAQALHRGIAEMAAPAAGLPPGAVPLPKVLEEAGLTFQVANQPVGAMSALTDELARLGKLPGPGGSLFDLAVPADVAKDLVRFTQAMTTPDGLLPFVKVWDSLTNLFKAYQTAPWPAHKARNQMTALFQNWVHDAYDPTVSGVASYVKPWLDAKAWREGKVIPGANAVPGLERLTDAEATKVLAREIQQWDVPHRAGQQAQEIVGNVSRRTDDVRVAGEAQEGLGAILGGLKDVSAWKQPLGVRGAFGQAEDVFAPVKVGRQVETYLDDVNRVSAYLAKRKQGYTPEAAAAEALKAHMDFSNLSGFEKSVVRRLIPFYTWQRQIVPEVLGELLAKPGGKLGMAVKGAAGLRQEEGFLPDYLGSGVALPLGDEGGTRRYLTGLGLPFEDVLKLLPTRGVSRGVQQLLGETNPLVKAPLELAAGKQFFSGRELHDLYGPTGDPELDQLVMNSPLSRLYTTGRTILDERKGPLAKATNLLTGARVSDVDVEKQKNVAARSLIEEVLRGEPGVRKFERISVRPEDVAKLTPEDAALLRLYQSLEARSRASRKAAAQK